MATVTKTGTQAKPTPRPVAQQTVKREAPKNTQVFLFDSNNYKWMIGGVVLILIGFAMMTGGKSPDPHQFNFDEIFSSRRITLAPMVMLLGFFVEVYAIMKKPKDNDSMAQ